MALPANASQDIVLTYNATGVAAGTYRAQLCLFADYSYSEPAASLFDNTQMASPKPLCQNRSKCWLGTRRLLQSAHDHDVLVSIRSVLGLKVTYLV